MTVTVYRNIPARRLWNRRIVETPIYRRIMRDIERALKAGGCVHMESSPLKTVSKNGEIVERITVTIDTAPADCAMKKAAE